MRRGRKGKRKKMRVGGLWKWGANMSFVKMAQSLVLRQKAVN
jgi:hypothetical protein